MQQNLQIGLVKEFISIEYGLKKSRPRGALSFQL